MGVISPRESRDAKCGGPRGASRLLCSSYAAAAGCMGHTAKLQAAYCSDGSTTVLYLEKHSGNRFGPAPSLSSTLSFRLSYPYSLFFRRLFLHHHIGVVDHHKNPRLGNSSSTHLYLFMTLTSPRQKNGTSATSSFSTTPSSPLSLVIAAL